MPKGQKRSIPQVFGRGLKELRTLKGLTQDDIALECGIDRSFISLIESGKKQPTITTIVSIAAALEVKPSELVKAMEPYLDK